MEQRQDIFKVRNDVEADQLISDIRELQADRNRFEMIFKARMDQLKADFEREVNSIDSQVEFKKSMLQAYFLTVPAKETKTMSKYKLLSGSLVMKKPSTKISHDDKEILNWAISNAAEYVKQEPKLEWSKLKEVLQIKDGAIINKETGEVLTVEGLKLEQVNEKFEVSL